MHRKFPIYNSLSMKLRKLFSVSLLLLSSATMFGDGTSSLDLNKPFGFCTVSSRTSSSSTYNITGGGCYEYPVPASVNASKVKVLTSTGENMRSTIESTIKNDAYSVIIFDGSNGDFKISSNIGFSGLKNKTILGINNAKLCTTWYATEEILNALDAAGVPKMSTNADDNKGGKLVNGQEVKEEAEYYTRKIIIEKTGDTKESYRNAGVFSFNGCENLIIRNLKFQGPGSIDVGGSDLISFTGGTKHCWVDHCDFADGMDGNFDITQASDFNTVSWCTFSYSSRSYMHQNTNLIGSADSEATSHANTLNTTFAFNHWGTGCRARMPMGRVGKIHMLNNYFTCTTGGNCINPRIKSEFLIEGNYFGQKVYSCYGQSKATAVTWKSDNIIYESKNVETPKSFGTIVTMPYTYTVADANDVPTEVGTYAGATLYGSEQTGGGDDPGTDDPETPALIEGNNYVIGDGESVYDGKQIKCNDITMTYGDDGKWSVSARNFMSEDGFSNLAGGDNNPKNASNKNYTAANKQVPVTGTYYVFKPTANGTLYVATYIYTGKKVFVTEDSEAISFKAKGKTSQTNVEKGTIDDATVQSGNSITDIEFDGYVYFPVTANKEYYLFGESTKIKIYGFNFVPDKNPTGISVTRQCPADYPTPAYNMAGQRVSSSQKGIVIINKKVVLR